jgi:hypothetical protein
MLTPENTDLIKQSIFTLIFTLKNIEVCTFCHFCSDVLLKLNKRLTEYLVCVFLCHQSISSDISGFTGDETTRQNIKLLIKSLSRLL